MLKKGSNYLYIIYDDVYKKYVGSLNSFKQFLSITHIDFYFNMEGYKICLSFYNFIIV